MIQLLDSFPSTPERAGVQFDFMSDEDLNAFVYTQISSGTAAVIDTNATGRNGILQFSSVDATEDKGAQIQLDAEPFQLADGKDLRFFSRFQLSAVEQSDCLHGLAITDTSLIASAPSDGIYFQSVDGSSLLKLVVRAGSALVLELPLATLVDATFVTAGFKIQDVNEAGSGRVLAWINGTLVASSEVAGLPTSEALSLSHAFQSGAAAIQTMNLDFTASDQAR